MTAFFQKPAIGLFTLALAASLSTAAQAEVAVDRPGPFAAAPVSDLTLQSAAGREDLSQIAQAELNAAVSKNSIGDNSSTGEVRIADNAFQNLSGLSVLNINTGNNVAINASMNVNISINPGP